MEGGRLVVLLDELGRILKLCRIVHASGMRLNLYHDFVKEPSRTLRLSYSSDTVCVVNITASTSFTPGAYVCSCISTKCAHFHVRIYVIVEFENGCFDIAL